jgi:hypothetical protein
VDNLKIKKLKIRYVILLLVSVTIFEVAVWNIGGLFESGHHDNNFTGQENNGVATYEQLVVNDPFFAEDVASGKLSWMSDSSLEMRENVDFLLTPAILVQECISEDVIIVYPED